MILNILKSTSEGTRLKILTLLYSSEEPVCVGLVEFIVGISESSASRHLKRLLKDKLVVASKKTQYVYYELNTDTFKEYKFLSVLLDKYLEDSNECKENNKRLKEINNIDLKTLKEISQKHVSN